MLVTLVAAESAQSIARLVHRSTTVLCLLVSAAISPLTAVPDLTVFITSVVPRSVAAGDSISISFTVENQGVNTADLSGLWLWRSQDSVLDVTARNTGE